MEVELRFTEGIINVLPRSPKGRIIQKEGVSVWHVPGSAKLSLEAVNQLIEEIRDERGRIEDRTGH